MVVFTFTGPLGAVDELGVWQAVPATVPRDPGHHLDAQGPARGLNEANLWRVSLPQERASATGALASAQARVAATSGVLPLAAARLAAIAEGRAAATLPPELEGPELELTAWAMSSGYAGAFAFWGHAPLPIDEALLARRAGEASVQASAFFDKVRSTVRHYAAIDTELGGRRIALTLVSWTGDFRSTWAEGLAVPDAEQHMTAVGLALQTRDAWLRMAVTVVRGAVQLAVLFPANPLLALPAAYRFVRQVLEQAHTLGSQAAEGR